MKIYDRAENDPKTILALREALDRLGVQACPSCGLTREYPTSEDWWSNNGGQCYNCCNA